MAVDSVSGSSSYVNKSPSANHGMSGLVSGMDTDGLVEEMLSGTQGKIDKQQALKQQDLWRQEILQDLISDLTGFQTDYFHSGSVLDKNNGNAINSASTFDQMKASSNSSAVSVVAGTKAAAGTTTVNVAQLATNASVKSSGSISGKLTAGSAIDGAQFGADTTVTLSVQVDSVVKNVSINLQNITDENGLKDALQKELNKAHGNNTLKVDLTSDNKLTIEMAGGDSGRNVSITGEEDSRKVFGFRQGESNKVALGMKVEEIGFTGSNALTAGSITVDGDVTDGYAFTINGESFQFEDGTQMVTIINAINESNIGVKISYNDLEDKFVMESLSTGTGYDIEMEDTAGNLLSKMFGTDSAETGVVSADATAGQNAVVEINGVWTERSTNIFTNNGLTFTLTDKTGSFDATGYTFNKATGKWVNDADSTEKTTKDLASASFNGVDTAQIKTSQDTEKLFDTIVKFVDTYNSLIDKMNGLVDSKATYKDYAPLTNAQKNEMSDKEIEEWEKKAKEGLLRSDSDMEKFLYSMRSILYYKPENSSVMLFDLGIETTSDYKDKGKLTIDEEKLRAALQSNLDDIKTLFTDDTVIETREEEVNGKTVTTEIKAGIGHQMYQLLQDTVKDSASDTGSLIQRAGGKRAKVKDNDLSLQMQKYDDRIKDLKAKYEKERQRYWNKFNAMEKALAQMQSQSSWLMQQFS